MPLSICWHVFSIHLFIHGLIFSDTRQWIICLSLIVFSFWTTCDWTAVLPLFCYVYFLWLFLFTFYEWYSMGILHSFLFRLSHGLWISDEAYQSNIYACIFWITFKFNNYLINNYFKFLNYLNNPIENLWNQTYLIIFILSLLNTYQNLKHVTKIQSLFYINAN